MKIESAKAIPRARRSIEGFPDVPSQSDGAPVVSVLPTDGSQANLALRLNLRRTESWQYGHIRLRWNNSMSREIDQRQILHHPRRVASVTPRAAGRAPEAFGRCGPAAESLPEADEAWMAACRWSHGGMMKGQRGRRCPAAGTIGVSGHTPRDREGGAGQCSPAKGRRGRPRPSGWPRNFAGHVPGRTGAKGMPSSADLRSPNPAAVFRPEKSAGKALSHVSTPKWVDHRADTGRRAPSTALQWRRIDGARVAAPAPSGAKRGGKIEC